MISSLLIVLAMLGAPDYPESRRVHHTDVYHGTTVNDPYRWLENDVRVDEEVDAWVDAQADLTRSHLDSLEHRDAIEERLEQLWNYPKFRTPFKVGGRYFFSANTGLQNQDVLYTMESLDSDPTILLDPNTWSDDGTVALGGTSFSDDGRYMSYAVADAGSDWKTWKIRNLETDEDLDETIEWSKFSTPEWMPDGSAFYYCRYDAPEEGAAFLDRNVFMKLYRHVPGTPQSEDTLVLEDAGQSKWTWGPSVSEDGRWLVVTVWRGSGPPNLVKVRDLSNPDGGFIDLVGGWEDEYEFVEAIGDTLYFMTDKDAPRKRLLAADMGVPGPIWSEVIPEQDATLKSVSHVNGSFVANYMQDASTRIHRFSEDGTPMGEISLPGIGSAGGFTGLSDDSESFYSFTSFTTPPTSYHIDLDTGETYVMTESKVDFNPADYSVEQVFYSSKDGTRVPMFLVHRKDMVRNGQVPTLLYGYGGFDISLTPYFSPSRVAWVEMGGLLAIPNLRGGGEYGREWHEAGTKTRKQNVFDDFIAAAEWLIDNDYTTPDRLAIQGGSNGGLLVGACMTQRPDLYGACLPAVGVMDMLRFHKFTIGAAWQSDFGDISDPEIFKALHAYSPYHNLKPGTAYPATMVTTADTDDRVVPGHSFKFAAALQYAHAGDEPVLIRIDRRAGHGAGKPTRMRIIETADVWAFIVDSLDVDPVGPVGQAQSATVPTEH